MWQRDPAFWSSSAPILFPVVGRQRDGVITVEGRQYPMPTHGFLRHRELEVVSEGERELTLRTASDDETRKAYPWEFEFTVTYTLEKDTLTQRFFIKNQDERTMYFCLGGHPGFNVPLGANEKFAEYRLFFEKEEALWSDGLSAENVILPGERYAVPALPCEQEDDGMYLSIDQEMFRNGNTLIFEDLQSRRVKLQGPAGKGVQVMWQGFSTIAFWTKGEPDCAPFLCIEPWYGMGMREGESPEFAQKAGVCSAEPGETFETEFAIQVF